MIGALISTLVAQKTRHTMWVASVDLGYAFLPNAFLFSSTSSMLFSFLAPYVIQLFKLWMGDLRLQLLCRCVVYCIDGFVSSALVSMTNKP